MRFNADLEMISTGSLGGASLMAGEMLELTKSDEIWDLVSIPATGQVIAVGKLKRSWPCSSIYNWTTTEDEALFINRFSANLTVAE
jgi:hypothetical protein